MDDADLLAVVSRREPNRVITAADGSPYLEHYHLARGLRLHRLLQSDPQGVFHNHPWDYRTRILSGSYIEVTPDGEQPFTEGDVLQRTAGHLHRLIVTEPAVTLFRYGPVKRGWGFLVAGKIVPHRTYLGHQRRPPPNSRQW